MLHCWQENPDARPSFTDIVDILKDMAAQDKVCRSYTTISVEHIHAFS